MDFDIMYDYGVDNASFQLRNFSLIIVLLQHHKYCENWYTEVAMLERVQLGKNMTTR
jgi:hypothetical protein